VRVALASGLAALGLACPALADPCKAIPDRGPAPKILSPGKIISGSVVYVGDGDSLCVDIGKVQELENNWVEVRLADFYAPELHEPGGKDAKATLERIAKGRRVECVAEHRSFDRVVARCNLQSHRLGDLMRAAAAPEGGNGR